MLVPSRFQETPQRDGAIPATASQRRDLLQNPALAFEQG
jgi:hypothetical protein